MRVKYQMRVTCVDAISSAVLLAATVRVRRAYSCFLVVQHLVVHALNCSDGDTCARPVVVDCVSPIKLAVIRSRLINRLTIGGPPAQSCLEFLPE